MDNKQLQISLRVITVGKHPQEAGQPSNNVATLVAERNTKEEPNAGVIGHPGHFNFRVDASGLSAEAKAFFESSDRFTVTITPKE